MTCKQGLEEHHQGQLAWIPKAGTRQCKCLVPTPQGMMISIAGNNLQRPATRQPPANLELPPLPPLKTAARPKP